jgi:hypothetical protein
MSKGKQKVNYVGSAADVVSQGKPSWSFLYEVSTIRNPRYNIGDRVVLPDGRVFRYCKSGAVCDTFKANVFYNAIPATGIDYAVLAEGAAKGDDSVLLTSSAIAQTLDGLRGGNINITTGSDDGRDQQRGIIGNTACSIGGTCRVYLDAPLTEAVTTSWYAYCMPSPYSDVRRTDEIEGGGGKGKVSFVGYAAAKVNAANLYHWEQTWGPLSCSLYGSAVGKTQYMREVVFRYDGNLIHRGATGITGLEAQTAGFILDNNTADNGATFIMLQIAP